MSTQASGTDPGSKSAAEIERDVQQSRADIEHTLDAIQERLSPGQLVDQAVGYFRGGRGVDFARNLGDSIAANPIPVTLMGVGLAWMMISGQRTGRNGDREGSAYWGRGSGSGRGMLREAFPKRTSRTSDPRLMRAGGSARVCRKPAAAPGT